MAVEDAVVLMLLLLLLLLLTTMPIPPIGDPVFVDTTTTGPGRPPEGDATPAAPAPTTCAEATGEEGGRRAPLPPTIELLVLLSKLFSRLEGRGWWNGGGTGDEGGGAWW